MRSEAWCRSLAIHGQIASRVESCVYCIDHLIDVVGGLQWNVWGWGKMIDYLPPSFPIFPRDVRVIPDLVIDSVRSSFVWGGGNGADEGMV